MGDDQNECVITNIPRHRSPSFDREEVKLLLKLINEFKMFILNKSNTSSASRAKELAWVIIVNKFNNCGFNRTIDSLKYKWRNLVTNVRRQSKNLLDLNQEEFDEFSSQVSNLIHDEDINIGEVVLPPDLEQVLKEIEDGKHTTNDKKQYWDFNTSKEQDDSSGEDVKNIRNRSMNFTPEECKLLLKCVQAERKYIFSTNLSSKAKNMKNAAWSRITVEYNKKNREKRSKKVLKRKFLNMKHYTHKTGFIKYLKNEGIRPNDNFLYKNNNKVPLIKPEPLFEVDDEELDDNDDKSDSDDDFEGDDAEPKAEAPDPLSTVLNSDSDLGSTINIGTFNPFENNEMVKLKMELLKYKIENAKLERRRIENALREDAKAQESNAIDRALRLRAARLNVAAAECKLPASHPSLKYTAEELPAQAYLEHNQT